MDPCVEVRVLRHTGLPEALELEAKEHWNQTENDWKRILKLCPKGCFGAFAEQRLVGTVTTITYGREVAWVGMMLVKGEYRGRGIGKRLMRASLDYCAGCQIETIKLDATPAGRPLYESLGFSAEMSVQRWEGIARLSFQRTRSRPGSADNQRLYELDQRAFGADRRELLESLIADACCGPLVVEDNSSRQLALAGYALARRGARAFYAGPIVASDQRVTESLLDALFARLFEQKVYIDLAMNSEPQTQFLATQGFTKQRELTRMSRGKLRNFEIDVRHNWSRTRLTKCELHERTMIDGPGRPVKTGHEG